MKLSKRIAFLFFLFLPILFFGGEAQAATINSISGTFSNNSSVTISGSEFGIKNPVAPYKYDNFQYGSDKIGQAVSVSASGGRNWNHFSSCASVGRTTPETGFRYSNAHPRYTGDISGWKFFGTNTTYDNCYQGTSYLTLNKPDGFDQVYWSMWLLSETNGQNTKVRNVKIANWNYNDTNYPQGRWDFYPAQGSGSGHVYALSCGSENSNEWGVGASAFSYGAETWNRFEGSLVVGNPGVANGRYEVYKNANLLQTTGNVMIRNSASCPKPDTFFFTHYHDDIDTSYSPPAPEQNLYHGEIYFDITRARVELCNSSTWSARAHCEIQIPHTTWNNGQIQITVNPGSFTSGQTAYLFVIDANGNASNGYPVTIGSGGTTPTCSNCCSTSQTCSTAMTTVGTCTRCCATACQAASTDATAPRVTAFTITPTTLTVGASLTANYTVTDNTALARAELWRAPSGTNCTDTVKTGCVWTQITSTNITGTSRTGTFTSSPTAAGTFYYGLHAVDAAGNVGYESAAVRVVVNAATQTCTNCCTSTQTCPTAFTTVGTCTRCCATACQTAPQAGTLPIFPGATGWGTYTRAAYGGGSNPTVYRVTNLNASGSGSLEACVAASGPRVCIFETSGVIRITSNLAIRNPYITIAGQTAPNPGIMIRGAALTVLTHDVLVQHIRVRSGDADDGPDKSNRDSLQIDNNTGQLYNVVIDHCSFSWSVDENASVWHENIYNVSVINSIFSEALYLAGHPENPPDVPHSMGFIIGEGIDRTTVAYTLLAHNNQRNIRLKPNSSAEQINTVVYNYGTRAVDTEGNINVIGNQFIPGDNTEADSSIFLRISAARVYTRDNINAPSGNASSPVAALGISNSCILPSSAVLNYVLNYAGARPANRDTVDTRIINEVRNRTGSFKNTVAEAGGWPVLVQNTRALTVPTNPHTDSDGDGYTNLEEWLHQYSSQVEGGLVSACQTASGDTIAPVVSAFSITPTT